MRTLLLLPPFVRGGLVRKAQFSNRVAGTPLSAIIQSSDKNNDNKNSKNSKNDNNNNNNNDIVAKDYTLNINRTSATLLRDTTLINRSQITDESINKFTHQQLREGKLNVVLDLFDRVISTGRLFPLKATRDVLEFARQNSSTVSTILQPQKDSIGQFLTPLRNQALLTNLFNHHARRKTLPRSQTISSDFEIIFEGFAKIDQAFSIVTTLLQSRLTLEVAIRPDKMGTIATPLIHKFMREMPVVKEELARVIVELLMAMNDVPKTAEGNLLVRWLIHSKCRNELNTLVSWLASSKEFKPNVETFRWLTPLLRENSLTLTLPSYEGLLEHLSTWPREDLPNRRSATFFASCVRLRLNSYRYRHPSIIEDLLNGKPVDAILGRKSQAQVQIDEDEEDEDDEDDDEEYYDVDVVDDKVDEDEVDRADGSVVPSTADESDEDFDVDPSSFSEPTFETGTTYVDLFDVDYNADFENSALHLLQEQGVCHAKFRNGEVLDLKVRLPSSDDFLIETQKDNVVEAIKTIEGKETETETETEAETKTETETKTKTKTQDYSNMNIDRYVMSKINQKIPDVPLPTQLAENPVFLGIRLKLHHRQRFNNGHRGFHESLLKLLENYSDQLLPRSDLVPSNTTAEAKTLYHLCFAFSRFNMWQDLISCFSRLSDLSENPIVPVELLDIVTEAYLYSGNNCESLLAFNPIRSPTLIKGLIASAQAKLEFDKSARLFDEIAKRGFAIDDDMRNLFVLQLGRGLGEKKEELSQTFSVFG